MSTSMLKHYKCYYAARSLNYVYKLLLFKYFWPASDCIQNAINSVFNQLFNQLLMQIFVISIKFSGHYRGHMTMFGREGSLTTLECDTFHSQLSFLPYRVTPLSSTHNHLRITMGI